MKSRITILLIFIASFSLIGRSQITMNFIPAVNGQRLDGLYFVKLVNATTVAWAGTLKIEVHGNNGQEIVQLITPRFVLQPGVNNVDRNAFSKSRIRFGNNYEGTILQQTGRFPEGEMEYCFEFVGEEKQADNNVFQSCFEHYIQPLTPLSLIYPGDGETICITRPTFLWQPPLPATPQTRFRIIVVESQPDKDPALALTNNLPVVNQAGIRGNTILYPGASPDLQQGKQYAWQIIAYTGNTIVSKSEIWTFTIKCDTPKVTTVTDSYRELKDVAENNHYIANGVVRFSYVSSLREGNLVYEIIDLRNPSNKLAKLPKVKAKPGLNEIDLDVSGMGLVDGQQYLLRVKRSESRWLMMRFIYKEPIDN